MAQEPLFIAFLPSLAEVSAEDWDACAGSANPFVSHAFLSALEVSESVGGNTGWTPYHMTIRAGDENGKIIASMPLYAKSHSYGEYVFDHGWADALERAGGRYYPKLQASIPFTPAITPKLLVHQDRLEAEKPIIQAALLDGLEKITEKLGFSSAHVTFLPDDEAKLIEGGEFLVRHDQQFHWKNDDYADFDAFLAALSSRKRKQIRKERQAVANTDIKVRALTGADITEAHWDDFFQFYIDTGARKWGQPYLTRAFFSEVGATMADQIVLVMCERDGRNIAGALNFLGKDTLYGRQWGCLEDHRYLHFEACYYQAIDFAIKHGLKTVEAGAQGAHKLARGYVPVQTTSAHYISNPSFRDAVARYLEQERQGVAAEIDYLATRTPFKKAD